VIGTITLNPSIDMHWIVDDFVKDDTNRARQVIETPGGKGINVSKVVRELGGKTRAFSVLGGLAGERLKELAAPLDFPLTSVPIRGFTRINMIISDVKDRTQSRISAPGPKVRIVEFKKFVRLLCEAKPRPKWWVFGGSLPQGMAASTYRELIEALQAEGASCVLDADNKPLKEGLKAKPYMIKPNEFEMQRLCGRSLHSLRDYSREAGKLVKSGIRIVVVSLGPKGALFVTEDRAFHILPPDVVVRSQLGAGDALIGGLLRGLQRKLPVMDAARLGVAASVSTVMREAPRLCRKSDIGPILNRLRVREI